MKYKILLIDVDDTIIEFKHTSDKAVSHVFDRVGIERSLELDKKYKEISHQLWSDYELGLVTIKDITTTRFAKTFEDFDIPYTGQEMDDMFRQYLIDNPMFMENAYDVLKVLNKNYKIYVITNGVASTQRSRIERMGLETIFEDIFISSDVGYSKPDKKFFEAHLKDMNNYEEMLIIGDSLSADIQGGINMNIDTCWFNPHFIENTTGIKPKYSVNTWLEVLELLGGY